MDKRDNDIWDAFRQGDREAFELLLLRYYRAMFDYGLRFQPDPDQLRDDLHDLMISLWERRTFLQPTEHLKLYLFKALRHQIFRGKQRLASSESLNAELADTLEVNDWNASEEDEQIRTLQIQKVMRRLTRRQQEILHLRFFEDLTHAEIAELLNISRPAVANLLYTALKAFRSLWKGEFFPLLLFLMTQ